MQHILSMYQNCNLYKNSVVIDGETTSKKRALANKITKEIKGELLKNKAPANVTSANDTLAPNTFIELTRYQISL